MSLGALNTVEYYLYSKSQGEVRIPEPIGYLDGNGYKYERDSKSKGFLRTETNTLKYTGAGFDFILTQYATKGIAEEVYQFKRIKSRDRLDERWRRLNPVYLDISEARFNDDEQTVEVDATQGGLFNLLDTKLDDEFDMVDSTSVVGTDIGVLKTTNVIVNPREIFLRSEGVVEPGTEISAVVSGGDGLNARTLPFKFDINSDRENIQSSFGDQLSAASGNYTTVTSDKVDNITILNVPNKKNLTINGYVKVTIINAQPGSCSFDSVFYDGGNDLNFKSKQQLDSCNPGILGDFVEFTFTNWSLELQPGESWTLGLLSDTADGIRYRVDQAQITITENSGENLVGSSIRFIKPFDLCERLVAKITGKNGLVSSSLLEEGGELEGKLLTQGFWVRGFPDIINQGSDEERKIQFITSLVDFLDFLESIRPIAWWTEVIGDKELLRIESLEYTMQKFVGIKYGEVIKGEFTYIQAKNVIRKNLRKNFYSKLIFGSNKGGDGYEEVFGLQSICGRAEFSTINVTNDSEYSKLSPYRMGDIDVELARRKPFDTFPDEDTKYDSDIMCVDCKKVGSGFAVKKWEDVLAQKPTGVYRPDSGYNYAFTPVNFLRAHSFVINAGLYHYPAEFIRFSSSNCNSSFSSVRIGEVVEFKEDQPIPHTALDQPRFKPKSVEFTLGVEQELEDQIIGFTQSGVQNRFGLVAVLTQEGIEYMILNSVDTNNEGKHILVEAYL